MNRGLKNDEIYDDIDNGLLFLETGIIVHRKEYIDSKDSIYYGSYNLDDDGNGIISGYKTKEKLGFFKYGIPYYSKLGLLKLGNMDVHIMGKDAFEDTIIRYLSTNSSGKHKHLYINLDGTLDDMRLFFLKYINNIVLTKIMWYLTRGKSVSIRLEIKYNKIIYSVAHYLDGVDIDNSMFYNVNDFLKAYETMGLELAPATEEDRQYDYPKTKDELKPFRIQTGGARCIMNNIDRRLMEEIKNLDAKTLYPKTTTINNLSIHDDKIIEAYNQLLTMMFDKEKYDGISIRVTKKDCDDLWFEILPCFINVRSIEYKATIGSDLCTNIKKNSDGNYIYSITDVNYIYNNEYVFSNHDKILNINISDLQTRLIDIIMDDIEDIKSPIVGQGDEVKLGNKISSELKDTGSRTQIRYDSDGTSGATLMRCYNNLLRGLPFDHIDNFDFEGDTIMNEIKFKNELSGLKEPNPTDLSDWVNNNNNNSNFDKNFKHMDLTRLYLLTTTPSLFKRLPTNTKYYVNDVVYDTELKILNALYNTYIISSDIPSFDYINGLTKKYEHMFKHHIEIGILYPKLKFNHEYGYYLNNNHIIEYGIVNSNVVPFDIMVSTDPIDVYKDIEYKYNIFVSTQSNLCHAQSSVDGVQLLDIIQADKCKKIYRTIFSKYIDLGVLKNTLELVTVRSDKYYKFSNVNELYIRD